MASIIDEKLYGGMPPPPRLVSITIRDMQGRPVGGARVTFTLNGVFAGTVNTGSGTERPITLELHSQRQTTISLEVRLLGQIQTAILTPQLDSFAFVFKSAPHFAIKVPPLVQCPDGTTGSPCVICHEGNDSWRICA